LLYQIDNRSLATVW